MLPPADDDPADPNIIIRFGRHRLHIIDVFETLSIINDALIAIEFLIGSIFFFGPDHDPGVWLFVVGSIQLAVRPALRLSRRLTLRRMGRRTEGVHVRWQRQQEEF
ncbi:YrhK family protein [Sciscionella sediminilitoris]|uniref:YrhK family protein n=1 Tax=Sciscionella sediminilitoris TaxID=1445613 RepID=UPI00068B7086|nr:YrhK family protein [Sciscionella sp. SE31]